MLFDNGMAPLIVHATYRPNYSRAVDIHRQEDYNESMEHTVDRNKLIVRTSAVGIVGNILLVIGKIIVGVLAHSISIVSDGVNNLTDAMSSIVTMVGTRLAGKRPDKQHPYGHGRLEFVTSSVIAMLIFVAGASAIYSSIRDLVEGSDPTYDVYSFVVIGLAVLVKIALGLYYRHNAKRAASDALRASGIDALWDSVLSAGTLIGAGISYATGVHLEGYIGIVIGLFILKSAVGVFRESISKIIGERTDPELVNRMVEDIGRHPMVSGVYDLIINNYGTDHNIASVHVQVSDSMTAREIQQMEREIAFLCYDKYHTIMTVGVYAENAETEHQRAIRDQVHAITAKYPAILQTHGFFLDEVNQTVSVDIIIDFDVPDAQDICESVRRDIQALLPDYRVHVVLDRDFSVS